jgi:hypothetical protein
VADDIEFEPFRPDKLTKDKKHNQNQKYPLPKRTSQAQPWLNSRCAFLAAVRAKLMTTRQTADIPPIKPQGTAMSRRNLYLICLSLIASSLATSALADACPTAATKLQFLSSGPPTRSTNFTPMPKFAQESVECIQFCKKEYPCSQNGTCNPQLQQAYLACLNACG